MQGKRGEKNREKCDVPVKITSARLCHCQHGTFGQCEFMQMTERYS